MTDTSELASTASSYMLAEQDAAFLAEDSMRGLRLQLEYLKPEIRLAQHGIEHTIVVFGSTRTIDPELAAEHLAAAETEWAHSPQEPVAQMRLSAARRAKEHSHYYTIARELGRLVGNRSLGLSDEKLYVMTGGGPGIMEAAHRGASDVGAKSVGLNIHLPEEQNANRYVTPELCFRFHYFALRKLHFLHRARALVVFPGGLGTLDELFETLTLISTEKIAPLPVILVGERFWRQAIDFDYLVAEGTLTDADRSHFRYCETADEIWRCIETWYSTHERLTKRRAE